MDNISKMGYKDNSPYKNRPYNLIQGNLITMKGVNKRLTLVPIIGGKPDYEKQVTANPGDEDIQFDSNVESVLEIPNALMGGFPSINFKYLNPYLNANENINDSVNYYTGGKGSSLMENNSQPFLNPQVPNVKPPVIQGFNSPDGSTPPSDEAIAKFNSQQDFLFNGENKIETDPNTLQKMESSLAKYKEEKKDRPFTGAINPYGGWNLQNSTTALGAFIQDKNLLGTIGSAGKILLEGTRNVLGGAAAMKRYQEDLQDYYEDEENSQRASNSKNWHFMQKGGEIGKVLTGNYIKGNEEHPSPNLNAEKGEYMQTPDGNTMEILGNKHSEGGENFEMPEGTKVISDYLKIGNKLSTYFKKEYDLNVRAGSTFSTVLDQYKKKIGLTKILEEEADLLKKVEDQQHTEFEGSREINLQVLSKKINELQSEKFELENKFENFTNFVFEKQEDSKKSGNNNFEKQEGGSVENQPNIEEIIITYSQLTGEDPESIIQQLQQLPEEEINNAINSMISYLQQAQSQQVEMQSGGMVISPLNFKPKFSDLDTISKEYNTYDIYNLNKIANISVTQDTPEKTLQRIRIANEILDKRYGNAEYRKNYIDNNYDSDFENKIYTKYSELDDQTLLNKFRNYGGHKGGYYTHEINALGRILDERHINPITATKTTIPKEISENTPVIKEDPTINYDNLSFGKAYAEAGRSMGQGAIFSWRGKKYIVNNKKEGGIIYAQYGVKTPRYDDGYIKTSAEFKDWKDYNPVVIKLGKSILGGADVENESYNPGSVNNVQDFLNDAETLIKLNPKYESEFKKLSEQISKAKTDTERFNILNTTGQKIRQKAFLEVAPDELKGYVGMGYAPTQTQLQDIYNGLSSKKEKDEFSQVLRNNGWGITDQGSVQGGNFKYNENYKKGNSLYDFIDKLQTSKPDLYNKVAISNINDGVYDRRRENIREMRFKSIADRDSYYNEKGFVTKGGYWVDPDNRNNIIIPKVYRDKEVTQAEYDEWKKRKDADIEGYKDSDQERVFEKYIVKGTQTPPQEEATLLEETIVNNELGNKSPQGWESGLPMMVPDQSNLPPNLLQPRLRQIGHVQANTIRVSPEETLKELNRQYNTASTLASEINPYTSGAMQANLQAQTNDSINQAYSQSAIVNAQDERNVENMNEQRIQQRDEYNLNALNNYERNAQVALQNYYDEWRGFIDKRNLENVNNFNLQNQMNAFNAVNDNYKIGSAGQLYQTNESPIFYVDGKLMFKDPKTGSMHEITTTVDDKGNSTVKTSNKTYNNISSVPKKGLKKGGMLLSKDIKNWLK